MLSVFLFVIKRELIQRFTEEEQSYTETNSESAEFKCHHIGKSL